MALLKGLHGHTRIPAGPFAQNFLLTSPLSILFPSLQSHLRYHFSSVDFLTTPHSPDIIVSWASLQYFMYILFIALLGFEGFD